MEIRLKIIGACGDGASALQFAQMLRPDIVLLDIDLPKMDGLYVAKAIRKFDQKCQIVLLSSHANSWLAGFSEHIGANALCSKAYGIHAILDILENMAKSNNFVSKLEEKVHSFPKLSKLELLISFCLAEGLELKEIVERYGRTASSIRNAKKRLFKKLKVQSTDAFLQRCFGFERKPRKVPPI